MGPLEVVAIEFPGNRFKGETLSALASAVEHGAIRVIDVTFLCKDASGTVTMYELAELDECDAAVFDLVEMTMGILSVDDIATVSQTLAPESSAAVLVIEHAWAAELEQAILCARGRLVGRHPVPDTVARAALESATARDG